jgi:hypothetical protein
MSLGRLIGSFLLLALIAFHLAGGFVALNATVDHLWGPAEYLTDLRFTTMPSFGGLAAALALLLGAGLGAGIGPRWSLVVGAALCVLGAAVAVAFAMTYIGPLSWVKSILLALGGGVAVPALLASTAADLHDRREGQRSAQLALVVCAGGLGVLFATVVGNVLAYEFGLMPTALMHLGGMLVAALGAVGLALIGRGVDVEPPAADGKSLAMAAGVAVLVAIPLGLVAVAQRDMWFIWGMTEFGSFETWAHGVFTAAGAFLAFVIALILYRFKPTFPGLLLGGVGLLTCGIGLAVTWVLPGSLYEIKRWAGVGMLLLVSGGGAAAIAFGASRALGDLPPRAVTAMAALFLLVMGLTEWLFGFLQWKLGLEFIGSIVPLLAIAACVLFGLALAIAAIPLQRRVWAPPETD